MIFRPQFWKSVRPHPKNQSWAPALARLVMMEVYGLENYTVSQKKKPPGVLNRSPCLHA